MDELTQEYAVYETKREELEAAHFGKYVLIKRDEIVGTFETLDDALRVAVKRFGRGPYLIEEIGLPVPEMVLPISYGAQR